MEDKFELPEHLENAIKAYDNSTFLHSREGRVVRILSEYLHPEQHLRKHGIYRTIIIFGSARIRSEEYLKNEISKLTYSLEHASAEEQVEINQNIRLAEKGLKTAI